MPDIEEGAAPEERSSLRFSSRVGAMPSLDWTVLHLAGVWAQDGEMISCPFVDHEDDTPSFNLWAPDEQGVPQRFGCFGCGRKGTVLEFIMEWEGIHEVGRALLRAGELAEEEQSSPTPSRAPVKEKESVDLGKLLIELQQGVSSATIDGFTRYMRAKGMSGDELEQYVMDEWEWLPAGGTAIAAPHRDAERQLVGVKFRALDRKWSAPGSVYDSLYGAWRDRGRQRVLLCEGESDTVWAAWSMRDASEWDVLGLPSGAQQPIRREWLEHLADRELYLALDGDTEGIKATRAWMTQRPDALLVRLPEGEDLLQCGIPVRELIERAESPRRQSGIVSVADDVFSKATKDGTAPIADFCFKPIRELYTSEGPAWEVVMSGDRQTTLIRASDFASAATLTRWANRHGVAWLGGSGVTVQGLFNWVKARSAYLPLERATTRAGKTGRSFVGPGLRIGPDRVRYIAPALGDAKLESRLHIEDGPWDTRSIVALEHLNDPGIMAIILGWITASLLRGQTAPAPPLFVAGESGAGKTNLLSTTLGSLGFGIDANLTTTTPYGVDCFVNSCVGFPVWFDEYRHGAREDSMQRLRQLLRDAYYGQPSVKGGMTSQATELSEVWTWSAIVVSGEMSSQETSHRDRMIMLDLNPDAKDREALRYLGDRERTRGLGHALLTFLAARRTPFVVRPLGDPSQPERFREALGFVDAGWQAWLEFRWEAGLRDAATPPDFKLLSGERAQSVDPWLEALRACEGVMTRDSHRIVHKDDDGSIVLIPAEVIVEARRVGIELPARANELIQWLRRRSSAIEDTRVGSRRAKRVRGMEL